MRFRTLRLWRQYRTLIVSGALLLAAVLTTWVLRQTTVAEVTSQEAQWQANIAQDALARIEADFRKRYGPIERRARSMASDSVITAALLNIQQTGRRSSQLLRHVNAVRVDRRMGVEVRSHGGSLLAWKGVTVPVDARTAQHAHSIENEVSLVERDGEVRRALTVWWPVRHDGQVVGLIRTVRLVQFQPPVLNRYIQGFDLEADWQRLTGESISVSYAPRSLDSSTSESASARWSDASGSDASRSDASGSPAPGESELHVRKMLTGAGQSPLLAVTVRPPAGDRLIAVQTQKYDGLFVLWVVMVALWCVSAAWVAYRHMHRRESRGRAVTRDRRAYLKSTHWFAVAFAGWIGLRYLMVWLDVPGRWVGSIERLAPLFDPTHLASTFGGGILQSTGDLLVTALFAIVAATALVDVTAGIRPRTDSIADLTEQLRSADVENPKPFRFLLAIGLATVLILGSVVTLAEVVQRSVLDSTLDYFSRTGVLPEPLVLIVLCSLFLLAVSAVLASTASVWVAMRVSLRHRPVRWPRGLPTLAIAITVLAVIAACYAWPVTRALLPIPVTMTFIGVVAAASTLGVVWPYGGVGQLTLRGLLPSVLALTMLLYPMLYMGMDTQRRDRMTGAAMSFEEGRDPRVLFSIEQMLHASKQEFGASSRVNDARAPSGRSASAGTPPPSVMTQTSQSQDTGRKTGAASAGISPLTADSIATRLVRRSLLASLTTYEASLIFVDANGEPVERFTASGVRAQRTVPRASDRRAFEQLRALYEATQATGSVVDQLRGELPGQRATELVYAGILPLDPPSVIAGDGSEIAWVMVRAEPRSLLPGAGTGVPAVLLPDGSYSDLYAELSLAEFRDGALARSLGRDFGRARLAADLRETMIGTQMLWQSETVRGVRYLTLYRQVSRNPAVAEPRAPRPRAGRDTARERTIAVRIPAVLAFDHLYYILRLTIAGLCVTFLIYLLGLYGRYQRGLLPAPRVRFRDKVLSAFLAVGVVSMIAVGVVGVQVVTGENERVIERRLHDHLNRVEETLALEAKPGEMMYRVAERVDLDSLAARVGLDLRMYSGPDLRGTSRARLVRDRLVDRRMPIEVYRALYEETYRFTTAPSYIGSFRYVVGYQALPGEDGAPRYVLAVPTLAQQERIEEEQARTLAYLFGALLILVVVVMLTALLLANALARPIAQLREGLEAVGEGRFARVLPVNTRDEIGDLVRTFNETREQLRESRRKLAKQERELAWREMARQVAHEIKNPLTPMKLSIQHLQRAYRQDRGETRRDTDGTFPSMFDRITETLIEQIEALARIANEFSSFARLPTRVLEPMDLNEVIREAARLMREEASDVHIDLNLGDDPLVVQADREELRRIFINLIKNAIQAIPGHRDGLITIATTPVSGEGDAAPGIRCEIEDNGTGIPAGLRDKIFQPNFSTKTSGTGLGLAIARKSIEELDGQIGFDTVEGEGTTFWIRLPLAEEAAVRA